MKEMKTSKSIRKNQQLLKADWQEKKISKSEKIKIKKKLGGEDPNEREE